LFNEELQIAVILLHHFWIIMREIKKEIYGSCHNV
jgi:hypothetical protein